jgi:hypothetical protein
MSGQNCTYNESLHTSKEMQAFFYYFQALCIWPTPSCVPFRVGQANCKTWNIVRPSHTAIFFFGLSFSAHPVEKE